MQGASLTATDLACRRGDRVLFTGFSLALQAGDALRIAGPNGSGKTSLLRIVAGLLTPLQGKVRHEGSIGLVDERSALDPELTLESSLRFWAGIDEADAPAMRNAMARMGLTDLLDVPVRYLSTGQRKRAALARVETQGASIWLLDEPLNGLDSEGVELVEELLRGHCAAGGVALVASHQPIALGPERVIAIGEFAP